MPRAPNWRLEKEAARRRYWTIASKSSLSHMIRFPFPQAMGAAGPSLALPSQLRKGCHTVTRSNRGGFMTLQARYAGAALLVAVLLGGPAAAGPAAVDAARLAGPAPNRVSG